MTPKTKINISAMHCNFCGSQLEPYPFVGGLRCRVCRNTFYRRSLVAATIGALTAIAVAVLSTVDGYADADLAWPDVALPGWLFCILLYPVAGGTSPSRQPALVGLSIIFTVVALIAGIVFPFIEGRTVFAMTLPQELRVMGCILSIYLALLAYWLIYRRECRACGHRVALEPVEKRHIPEKQHKSVRDFFFSDVSSHKAAHDEALWKCKYCGHGFWRDVTTSYQN